jgi:hypothetical protein
MGQNGQMDSQIDRRSLLIGLFGTAASLLAFPRLAASQPLPTMTVYKSPTCGCCKEWVSHVIGHGFKATVIDTEMGTIKAKHNIPPNLQSCHTTLVGSYVIEGHVPASDVTRLLKEKPKGILGLTTPGMPASAPGMDVLPFQPYEVLTFDAKGQTKLWARHTKPA